MSTPAAAALFTKALNSTSHSDPIPSTSTSRSDAPPPTSSSTRGRGGRRGRGGGRGGLNGRVTDEDVGMSDASDTGANRRGRSNVRNSRGPMGERPQRGGARGGARNAPTVLREDAPRARSSPATTTPGPPPTTAGAIETLRLFLLSRYSVEEKMLNLENMASDTILKQAGLKAPGEKGAPSNVAAALWKLVGELFPEIVSISLANNSLTSILPLSPYLMTISIPNIRNVSLAANLLTKVRDLDPLSPVVGAARGDKKPKGWRGIQELVLTGNPMAETGAGAARYHSEMARRFPSLKQLDQQPIDVSIAFNVASQSSAAAPNDITPGLSPAAKREEARQKNAIPPVVFPVEVKGGFHESEQTRDFVASFYAKFFEAFDKDRSSLEAAYAPLCSFSWAIDTTPPLRSKAKKFGAQGDKKFPNQHKLEWKKYLDGSRNLNRVNGPARRVANLHTTPASIISKLLTLPTTQHPLTDAHKFVFDAWTMPDLMAPPASGAPSEVVIYTTVHGEFVELPSKGVRSFSRTFILAPSPPGSPAQLAGWPCVILTDMFTIRGYSDPSAWAPPAPPPTAATAPPPVAAAPSAGVAPIPPQERGEGLTDQQHILVLQLQAATRLTYAFSRLCLEQNGWVPETAMANFVSLNASNAIPREAFMP